MKGERRKKEKKGVQTSTVILDLQGGAAVSLLKRGVQKVYRKGVASKYPISQPLDLIGAGGGT